MAKGFKLAARFFSDLSTLFEEGAVNHKHAAPAFAHKGK